MLTIRTDVSKLSPGAGNGTPIRSAAQGAWYGSHTFNGNECSHILCDWYDAPSLVCYGDSVIVALDRQFIQAEAVSRLGFIQALGITGARNMSLPPGQHVIDYFPRFGVQTAEPPPLIREPAVIRVEGALARRLDVPVSRLADLKRRALIADFHCVAGWTAQNLQWSGVTFRTFYESVIVPEAQPEPGVSHIRFKGADGYSSTLTLDDAFEHDVLLADQLGQTALNGAHGAPVRLVSPKQYGYKSTKHVCCIELHTREQADGHERAVAHVLLTLLGPHPRARVAEEERHRYLPAWMLRSMYWKLYRRLAGAARRGRRS